jgi:alkylhydroperoxidase family enzyme
MIFRLLVVVALVGLSGCARSDANMASSKPDAVPGSSATQSVATPVRNLMEQARLRVAGEAWNTLEASASATLVGADTLEPASSGRVMNSLRAMARVPRLVKPIARLYRTVLLDGGVPRASKIGMALRVAQNTGSPYVAAHMVRLLHGVNGGDTVLGTIEKLNGDFTAQGDTAESIALDYADWLTRDISGVTDARFRRVRPFYTDAQIVELTITVAYFNFYARLAEGLHLPVEPWALESKATLPPVSEAPLTGRVSLIGDKTIEWAAKLKDEPLNSARAMYLTPELGATWSQILGGISKDSAAGTEMLRQVSFAVSMANGCRYCSLHQVKWLKSVGVSPAKLLAMEKDDSALTPRELTAVRFARKLTAAPATLQAADWNALEGEFGEMRALEILSYASAFNYMNRFTDNLGLPSEDEAVKTYHEVYPNDWAGKKKPVKLQP